MSFIVTIISHTFLTHNPPWSSVDFLVCDYNLVLQPGTMSLHDDPFHIFIDIHTRGNTNFHKDQPSSSAFTKLPPTFVRLILTRLSRDDYLRLSPFEHPLTWPSEKDASCRVLLYKHLEDCRIKQPFQHDVLQTNLFSRTKCQRSSIYLVSRE